MRSWFGALWLAACARETDEPTEPLAATIRWTSYGVPHVEAEDFGGLGYGAGYAFARENACVLADQLVKVHGERARWFGRGEDDVNVDTDFGWLALGVRERARAAWPSIDARYRAVLDGYAQGYSRWIEEGGAMGACEGQPWVAPIDGIDLLTWLLALGLEGSGAVFVPEIGSGEPPSPAPRPPPSRERSIAALEMAAKPPLGSNGWAIGKDRTAAGGGMLLSNTHFPSVGEKRWMEAHYRVSGADGELDVYGASLMGVPIINVGFNRHVAWTHTVSFAPRFVAYILELDPEDPTRYAYDGGWREMTSETYTIEVLEDDGSVGQRTRTLYRSHYGPVINAPLIGWSRTTAISLRDVNEGNLAMFDVWYGMNTATDLDSLIAAHDTQGIPWVYTMAADTSGRVFFGDTSRVPNLSAQALGLWEESVRLGQLLPSLFADFGVFAVDGGDPRFEWVETPGSAAPGAVPPAAWPTDVRTDYVFNANDSPWLHNASDPIEGYEDRLYGPIAAPRDARTRMNARLLSEIRPGGASGEDGRFDLDELEAAVLGYRAVLSEELLPGVVERCAGREAVRLNAATVVDVRRACAVLAAWDGRFDLEAVGAVLWRELLASGEVDQAGLAYGTAAGVMQVAFDPADPVGTPRLPIAPVPAGADGVDVDPLVRALAVAVQTLEGAGFAVDARLGDVQWRYLPDGSKVGVPGGSYGEGTIGIAYWDDAATTMLTGRQSRPPLINEASGLTTEGYAVNDGNSWILALELTETGPRGRAVMTYSQSSRADSPHASDQAELFGAGTLRPVLFDEADVAANVVEELTLQSP